MQHRGEPRTGGHCLEDPTADSGYLESAEVGEITCNIFYFNTPQILSFQCVINMIKPNEVVHVLFFMLSLFF